MAYPSRPSASGSTPDRPKRYLIETRYASPRGPGVVAEAYSPGQHGRVPYPDTAQRILAAAQAGGEPGRTYYHVRIVDKGSQVTVCQAGALEPAPALG